MATKVKKKIFLYPVFMGVMVFLNLCYCGIYVMVGMLKIGSVLGYIILSLVFVGTIAATILSDASHTLEKTDKEFIIRKFGIKWKVSKIEDVEYIQILVAREVDYNIVLVDKTRPKVYDNLGKKGNISLNYASDPDKFKKFFEEYNFEYRR